MDGTGSLQPYAGYWLYAFAPCTLQVARAIAESHCQDKEAYIYEHDRQNRSVASRLAVGALIFSGCGGGGSGSGANKTLAGTLLGQGNAPLSGDTVYFDKGTSSQQSAVTDGNGQYRSVVPLSSITGSDSLTFYAAAGYLVDIVPVTLAVNTAAMQVTTVVPPSPPSGVTL